MLQVNALAFATTLPLSHPLSISLSLCLSVCAAGHCNCWPFNKRFRPNSTALLRMTAPGHCHRCRHSCPTHLPSCRLLPFPFLPRCSPLSNEPWWPTSLLLLLLLQSARFLCVPLSKIEFQIIFTALTRLATPTAETSAHSWHSALD